MHYNQKESTPMHIVSICNTNGYQYYKQCQECEEYFRSSKEKKFTPLSIEFLVNKCEK